MAEKGHNDDKDKDKAKKPRAELSTDDDTIERDPTNAATAYGLEDHVANAQDPRVNALRLSEQGQAERRASQGSRRPSETKKQPVTIPSHRDSKGAADVAGPANAAIEYGLEDHKATQQDPRVEEIKKNRDKLSRVNSEAVLSRPQPPFGHTPPVASTPVPHSASQPASHQQPPPSPPPKPGHAPEEEYIPPPPLPRPQDVPMPPPTMYTPRSSVEPPPAVSPVHPVSATSGVPVAPVPTNTTATATTNTATTTTSTATGTATATATTAYKAAEVHQADEDGTERCHSKLINTDVTFDPSKDFACKTTNTAPDTTGVLYSDLETGEGSDSSAAAPHTDVQTTQTTEVNLDECFEMAIKTVKQAGEFTLEANKERLQYTTKQHEHDLLTSTDNDVENMIIAAIIQRYPDHKFICEEAISQSETGQVELTNDPTWIIDPIDGTMNFVHHFPYYCISVALLVNKVTEFGIIYNPPMKDCYTARRGMGAHLNGDPIRTSGQQKLQHAMILQEYSSGMNDARNVVAMDNAKKLLKRTHAMRSIGSSAMGLAMIASGVADGFYYFGLHIWDMAAGNLLVTEAGGTVIDPDGGELDIMSRRCLAAATEPLARELAAELIQNYPSPRDDQPKSVNPNEYRPGGEKVDFNAQTEFTDSSESLVTENSTRDEFDKSDVDKDKVKDKTKDKDKDKEVGKNTRNRDKDNDKDKDNDTDKDKDKGKGLRVLGSREANATLGPSFLE